MSVGSQLPMLLQPANAPESAMTIVAAIKRCQRCMVGFSVKFSAQPFLASALRDRR
jgi:hypothetical protein